jgi:hypothetical protein
MMRRMEHRDLLEEVDVDGRERLQELLVGERRELVRLL